MSSAAAAAGSVDDPSSFPSGHTLSSAAFATAAALCLGAFIPLAFSVVLDQEIAVKR